MLELGARGTKVDPRLHGYRRYVGMDVHPGPNVDAVGDAHRLSRIVEGPFDAVYSISTFEHLAMPWQVVLEINRVLRVGGLVFTATHHTWPPHELPWDYWRYSRGAFEALFNAHTGFELVRVEEGLPGIVVPMVNEASTRRHVPRPDAARRQRPGAQDRACAGRSALGSRCCRRRERQLPEPGRVTPLLRPGS